jgi:predicted nucleic acid-binding protein
MKQILVDANVLISFLTDRNARQREKAAALLEGAAARKHRLAIHSMSIVEMVYVLTQFYHEDPPSVAEDVADLLAMPRWPDPVPALGDAILAAIWLRGWPDKARHCSGRTGTR